MKTAKIFEGKFGKQVKLQVELDFYLPEDTLDTITTEEVIEIVSDEERVELGEMVLNNLHNAVVVTEK